MATGRDHEPGLDESDPSRTSTSLLERLRQPFDPEAWSRFVSLYTPMIHSWARRMGLQEPDAFDLVQDVFVTLLRVLPTFSYDRDRGFRGWLRIVVLNTWRNTRKRADRRALGGALEIDPPAAGPEDLEAAWEAEYQRHLVGRALRIMRADFQETTWKACWEMVVSERPAADVAAELGLTVGAVYAAKVRVLNRMREELRELLD